MIKKPVFARLKNRGILRLSGPDARSFLQGLVTQDMNLLTECQSLYGAFLTPQGKFLHDFFMTQWEDDIFLEGEKERLSDLQKRLTLYRLRSKVEIQDLSDDYEVYGCFGKGVLEVLDLPPTRGFTKPFQGGKAYVDPRHKSGGGRVIFPRNQTPTFKGMEEEPFETYDAFRLSLGFPDGSRDMPVEKAIPLECGLDQLNGISFEKGCYLGQELTARTKYRGLIRKRLFPVKYEGSGSLSGEKITLQDQDVGEVFSSCGGYALVRLRLEAYEKSQKEGLPLKAGAHRLSPYTPKWMQL